jgi:hypothetical protein
MATLNKSDIIHCKYSNNAFKILGVANIQVCIFVMFKIGYMLAHAIEYLFKIRTRLK